MPIVAKFVVCFQPWDFHQLFILWMENSWKRQDHFTTEFHSSWNNTLIIETLLVLFIIKLSKKAVFSTPTITRFHHAYLDTYITCLAVKFDSEHIVAMPQWGIIALNCGVYWTNVSRDTEFGVAFSRINMSSSFQLLSNQSNMSCNFLYGYILIQFHKSSVYHGKK